MRTSRKAALTIVGLAALAGAPARADDLRGALDLARAVAQQGRAARDPLALIVAARIRRDLAMAPRGASRGDEPGLDTPASLLAEARRMARGDRRVASLADDAAATGEKGRERGPLYDIGRLAAGGRETYTAISFAAGRRAEVYVEASRRVAVTVRDDAGAPICADDAGGPVAYCWWTPERATTVSVEVVNPTREPNAFRLVTN